MRLDERRPATAATSGSEGSTAGESADAGGAWALGAGCGASAVLLVSSAGAVATSLSLVLPSADAGSPAGELAVLGAVLSDGDGAGAVVSEFDSSLDASAGGGEDGGDEDEVDEGGGFSVSMDPVVCEPEEVEDDPLVEPEVDVVPVEDVPDVPPDAPALVSAGGVVGWLGRGLSALSRLIEVPSDTDGSPMPVRN